MTSPKGKTLKSSPDGGVRVMMRGATFVLLAAAGLLPACAGGGDPDWSRPQAWTLVRVDLDRSLLDQRGSLPVFTEPGTHEFGVVPFARGRLSVSKEGRVVCRVTAFEPRTDDPDRAYRHPLVVFNGFPEEHPGEVVSLQRTRENTPLGRATRLLVERDERGILKVQAATGDKLLPYIYWFAPRPALRKGVKMPFAGP